MGMFERGSSQFFTALLPVNSMELIKTNGSDQGNIHKMLIKRSMPYICSITIYGHSCRRQTAQTIREVRGIQNLDVPSSNIYKNYL